jgi:RNA polymerase sigma factor (sigma-70 family)
MSTGATRMPVHHLRDLFGSGTLIGLTDGQLLARYAALNDGPAFESLVARHGSMVVATCRAILEHEHDVEDAFQATFLVLARKASSVRAADTLGGWLHRVAFRIALQAKNEAMKRKRLESELAAMRISDATRAGSEIDLHSVLHEEIERLPERERLPVVLCDLEGLTYEQAAGRLRCTEQALGYRLARARTRLRDRLSRRGVTASAPAAVMTAWHGSASAALPAAWTRAAVASATGGPTRATVAALTETMIRGMLMMQLKITSAITLAATACASFAVVALVGVPTGRQLPAAGAATAAPRAGSPALAGAPSAAQDASGKQPTGRLASHEGAAPSSGEKTQPTVTVRGRVLGPDGKPVAGAKLYLTPADDGRRGPDSSVPRATSGSDGRFRFARPAGELRDQYNDIVAMAANLGAGWVRIPAGGKTDDLTLQLVIDDAPISGQVIDLEGKPVEGATVSVSEIKAAPNDDIGPWLKAVKENTGDYLRIEGELLSRWTSAVPAKVMTDAEGRFRITGIGRNRLVQARMDGPTIAIQRLRILTRPGETIHFRGSNGLGTAYYAADFRYAASPTRPIVGVIRDKDTKVPLANIKLRSDKVSPEPFINVNIVETKTDAQGRYRLAGLPKGAGNRILIVPDDSDQPYVVSARDVPDTPGLDPVTVDVELKRGVWITGKVTDLVTGRPVPGANVEYFTFYSNPNHSDYDGFAASILWHFIGTKDDGTYRVAGIPGPGLVTVFGKEHYLRVTDREDEDWAGEKKKELYGTSPFAITHPINYGAIARVNPPKGVESVTRDITLDPGWDVSGTVLGPDGKPLAGARGLVFVLNESHRWGDKDRKGAEFTVHCSNPPRPRELLIHHPEEGLVGVAQTPNKKGDSITVQLQPGATVTGRLVDANGKPRAGLAVSVWFRAEGRQVWHNYSNEDIKTDRDGRFRVTALLPGRRYRLFELRPAAHDDELVFGDGLRPGETKELGDARMTVEKE